MSDLAIPPTPAGGEVCPVCQQWRMLGTPHVCYGPEFDEPQSMTVTATGEVAHESALVLERLLEQADRLPPSLADLAATTLRALDRFSRGES